MNTEMDMKLINILLALNNIPVVIKCKKGSYQAYSTQTGRVLIPKKDMILKGKEISPIGVLVEIASYTKDETLILIARMMVKGNIKLAHKILKGKV